MKILYTWQQQQNNWISVCQSQWIAQELWLPSVIHLPLTWQGIMLYCTPCIFHKLFILCLWVPLSLLSKPMIQTNPMFEWIRILQVGHMYVSLLCCKLSVYGSNRSTSSQGLRKALLIVYISLNDKGLRQCQWVSEWLSVLFIIVVTIHPSYLFHCIYYMTWQSVCHIW